MTTHQITLLIMIGAPVIIFIAGIAAAIINRIKRNREIKAYNNRPDGVEFYL